MALGDVRTFHSRDFPLGRLHDAKGGRFVSVCIPARDEEATIGPIVASLCSELLDRAELVDEVLVVDDGSLDATATVAADAGATVLAAADVLPGCGPGTGKGEALWKALGAAKGEVLAFCDADLREFDPQFVVGVLGPLLVDDSVDFVKGFYRRPLDGVVGEGGRVTELVARPVLNLLFPHLSTVAQPLAGEFAARRSVLEHVPFVRGYGVDLALLVDVAARSGVDAVAQVDLGTRTHRNRSLHELGPQAVAVLATALRRAGMSVAEDGRVVLRRPGLEPVFVDIAERPPIATVAAYRERS
ncbi:MAG TPA: glucosyl-3-phosphoglycerate synthase [Acidimicrobiales bacterium]|jgi:glucosyl-3-phosphoglycerate synthase|nr:glucosyl-3-phosphoglycerate synthase [Acidimicrobiales bacterium]